MPRKLAYVPLQPPLAMTRNRRARRSNLFGYLVPAYFSYKVILSRSVEKYRHWLTYWCVACRRGAGRRMARLTVTAPLPCGHGRCRTVLSAITVVELVADPLVSWFPFYYEAKIAGIVWLGMFEV